MTEPSEPSAPDEITAEGQARRSPGAVFAKGCGCLTACVVIGAGVTLAGPQDIASWGSGIIAIGFLLLVVGSSGLTGWWNK